MTHTPAGRPGASDLDPTAFRDPTRSRDPRAEPRPPSHAGTFYPASAAALSAVVDRCLAAVPASAQPSPLGILVPHAGLMYSGAVAAVGWASFLADPPDTVVIAGTNHVAGWLRGAGVWPSGPWLGPLGSTAIDDALGGRILALGDGFSVDRAAHRREHAIEVQLPFLQRALASSAIVPIAVSFDDVERNVDAGTRLGHLLGGERAAGHRVVIAISSDFAHYPADRDARRCDRLLFEPISAVDPRELDVLEASIRRSGTPGLVCGMCGIGATVFGLAALRAMGATRGDVLAEATSADVPGGDPWRTVGYAAVAFA